MANIKLDLSKFKHHSSDEKTTTLKHAKDGHTITIMHGKLSKDMQEQLKELQPQKMAEGGGILDRAGKYLDNLADKASGQKPPSRPDKVEQTTIKGDPSQKRDPMTGAKPSPSFRGYAEGGDVKMYDKGENEVSVDDSAPSTFLQEFQGAKVSPEEYKAAYDKEASAFPGANPAALEMLTGQNLDLKQEADEKQLAAKEQIAQDKLQQDSEQLKMQNATRARQGLAPIEQPQSALAPEAATIAAPAPEQKAEGLAPVAPVSQPQIADPMLNAINQQIAGKQGEANAIGKLGVAEAEIRQKQADYDEKAATAYLKTEADKADAVAKHKQDIDNGYIDPDKYWDGYKNAKGESVPGHSRMAAAIGMIIAGFNPTNRPNAAIEMINNEINRSLEAQKANLNSAHNLMAATMTMYKDKQQAQLMARSMMSDAAIAKLQQAAANAKSPIAQAQAQQVIGQLNVQKAEYLKQAAMQSTINDLQKEAEQDSSKMPMFLNALEKQDPAKAKDLRAREVSGVGFAPTAEAAKTVRETAVTADTVTSGIKRLQEINKVGGKSLSPELRKEADTIRSTLIGALRVPITGPGAMSDTERQKLEDLVPAVTDMFALDSNNAIRLETLNNRIKHNYAATLKYNSLNPLKAYGNVHPMEGKIVVSPTTGQRQVMKNGKWTPIK